MIKKSKLLIGTVILVLTSFTGCNKTPIKNNINYVVEASPSPSPVVAGDNIGISSKGADLNQNSATSQGSVSSKSVEVRNKGKTEDNASTNFPPNDFKGLWINKTYLSNIKKERSPLKAYDSIKDDPMLLFRINPEEAFVGGNLYWRFLGAHDFTQPDNDGTIKKISKDNEGVLHIYLEKDLSNTRSSIIDFQLIDNQVLRLLKDGKTADFLRVSESDIDYEKYIRKLLFAGYASQDSSGYRFDENAEATRNGIKLDYGLNLETYDTVNNCKVRYDSIFFRPSNNNGEGYVFKFQDDKLYLYKYNDGDDKRNSIDILNTTPIAVLTKKAGLG